MTDQYAVFGNPIAHSKSPLIHALFAKQTSEKIRYGRKRVPKGLFAKCAKRFFGRPKNQKHGLNVTVPFKLDAYQFADKLSERAKQAGAVNTLKRLPNGKIYGDNTDGIGLVRDITQNLGWEIKGKNILILGAGGAVRGVMGPLLDEKPNVVTIANRTRHKAEAIKNIFSTSPINIDVWDTSDKLNLPPSHQFDLIINGTSAQLNDEEWDLMFLLSVVSQPTKICAYDMMYGKDQTDFEKWAHHQKFKEVSNGLGMLVEQAAESFYIWRGVKPETKSVIEKIRKEL